MGASCSTHEKDDKYRVNKEHKNIDGVHYLETEDWLLIEH
jgi:hypothetical protein